MPLANERLEEITVELLTRPGHEKVRALLYDLIVNGLDIPSGDLDFERPLPEVRGRADALLGSTVIEVKRDLRAEQGDAEEELTRYISEREGATGRQFLGVATDGNRFQLYQLRGGVLEAVGRPFSPLAEAPRRVLTWLDSILAVRDDLEPTPERVRRELGRGSLGYLRARDALAGVWAQVRDEPDTRLKRELWADLLARVYGSRMDQDELWWQHTYLVIVAKAMALRVLDLPLADTDAAAADLLAGQPFADAGITGAAESDFFDWVLDAPEGRGWVMRIARHVARFRLTAVEHDILKVLYESLIDPEERHELGEFYTPDWLAASMVEKAITDPLHQRVLDPACGSGTFLFWSVRAHLEAADAAGVGNREAIASAGDLVKGIDIHPVAVLIARVTYLLALGTDRLTRDRGEVTVPVYLGDTLLWNTRPFLADREVLIEVPAEPEAAADGAIDGVTRAAPTNGTVGAPLEGGADGDTAAGARPERGRVTSTVLAFPFSVTRDPGLFDRVIDEMLDLSARAAEVDEFRAWLVRDGVRDATDLDTLATTYGDLRKLVEADRNHIWGYVARNLSRPIWLTTNEQQADVVIGNPPWLAYRFMNADLQDRFKDQSIERGIWAGGRLATHQDLSGLFFVRSVEFYLRPGGTIAFVMPMAVLSRGQFAGLRSGVFMSDADKRRPARRRPTPQVAVTFDQPWAFDERVRPLFPVPAAVIFARSTTPLGATLPATALAHIGELPRRDASPEDARAAITTEEVQVTALGGRVEGSPYRDLFRQGATVVPRMLWIVDRVAGRLGGNPASPLVESHRQRSEKRPWRDLPGLRGQVEAAFLRPLLVGASLVPYRILEPVDAVIPWHDDTVLTATQAGLSGFPRLAEWLTQAERTWATNSSGRMTLQERLDHWSLLTSQMPPAAIRVVYSKAGTLPAAAVLRDPPALVDHKLYWVAVETEDEARYLAAILNSETARARVAHLQSRGQWGARDFDKVMLSLPIPTFDAGVDTHRRLAEAAARAEELAAAVDLGGLHFPTARRRVREALAAAGMADEIDRLVGELIGPAPLPPAGEEALEIVGDALPDALEAEEDEDEAEEDEEAGDAVARGPDDGV